MEQAFASEDSNTMVFQAEKGYLLGNDGIM